MRKRYLWYTGALVMVCLLGILAFGFKKNSSSGRMLIYKISWNIYEKNYIKGIGLGKFEHEYGLAQADYFKSGNYTSKELWLADNTYYAFNDYFQFIIETGFTGVLLLSFLIIGMAYVIRASLKESNHPILSLAITQLFAVLIAAFFTHIFEKLLIQYMIIGFFIIILFFSKLVKLKPMYFLGFGIFIFSMATICHFWPYRNYSNYQKWQTSLILNKTGRKMQSLKIYRDIYQDFKQYPGFLENYAALLFSTGYYKDAEFILQKAIRKRTNNNFYLKLGDCYLMNYKFMEAEAAYQMAINIVPKRFGSHYALFNFYNEQGRIVKMLACGQVILNLPVKVASPQVNEIKRKVKLAMEVHSRN